jgi:hypothetical protein
VKFKNPLCALTLLALLAGLVPAAHAQEYAISRRTFSFYGNRLDIEVLSTSAGQLQILRGELGRVEVAANADDGVAGFGLGSESGVLRLTALGARSADFIVVVPERTRIRVKLPGKADWRSANTYGAEAFSWGATAAAPQPEIVVPAPELEGRFFVVASRAYAPERVRLLSPQHVRSLELRIEGTDFRIGSTRPFTRVPGAAELIDIDAGDADVDLLILVPSFTRDFELRVGSETLVRLKDGKPAERCGPAVRQTALNGSWRISYRPAEGLKCEGAELDFNAH